MNTQKRATKQPDIDDKFFEDVIVRNSPLRGEEARTLATAIVTEMRSALGRRGGRTTKALYGADHYSRIGKMGGRPKIDKSERED